MKKDEIIIETKKVQLSFTLKKGVNDRFLQHCKDNMINKSQLLESLIVAYFDSQDFAGMKKFE